MPFTDVSLSSHHTLSSCRAGRSSASGNKEHDSGCVDRRTYQRDITKDSNETHLFPRGDAAHAARTLHLKSYQKTVVASTANRGRADEQLISVMTTRGQFATAPRRRGQAGCKGLLSYLRIVPAVGYSFDLSAGSTSLAALAPSLYLASLQDFFAESPEALSFVQSLCSKAQKPVGPAGMGALKDISPTSPLLCRRTQVPLLEIMHSFETKG